MMGNLIQLLTKLMTWSNRWWNILMRPFRILTFILVEIKLNWNAGIANLPSNSGWRTIMCRLTKHLKLCTDKNKNKYGELFPPKRLSTGPTSLLTCLFKMMTLFNGGVKTRILMFSQVDPIKWSCQITTRPILTLALEVTMEEITWPTSDGDKCMAFNLHSKMSTLLEEKPVCGVNWTMCIPTTKKFG